MFAAYFNKSNLRVHPDSPTLSPRGNPQLPSLAAMPGDMLLDASDRHSYLLCQPLLFHPRELPEPRKPPKPVTSLQELAFEPSMLRAAYRKG